MTQPQIIAYGAIDRQVMADALIATMRRSSGQIDWGIVGADRRESCAGSDARLELY